MFILAQRYKAESMHLYVKLLQNAHDRSIQYNILKSTKTQLDLFKILILIIAHF